MRTAKILLLTTTGVVLTVLVSSMALTASKQEEGRITPIPVQEQTPKVNPPAPKNIDTWPIVAVDFRKVMAAMAAIHEQIRETEAPTAILLCTADDRLEMMTAELKEKLQAYQNAHHLRIDLLTETTELADYTDDFLTYLNRGSTDDE